MNTKKRFSSMIGVLLLIAVLAIGVFAFTGCENKECETHDFDVYPITVTCTSAGTVERVCKNCAYRDVVESEPLGHEFTDWQTENEATCSSQGHKLRYCKVCNEYEHEYSAKTEHSVETWAVAKTPTEDAVGKASGNCSSCSYLVEIELPKLSDTSYTVENIDSESQKYIYTTEGANVEFINSKYTFREIYGEGGEVIGYSIRGSRITTEVLTLPTSYNGKPVLGIDGEGFSYSSFKELIIPEGYKFLCRNSFYNHNVPIEKITLPSTIEELGKAPWGGSAGSAFGGVTNVYYNGTVESWCNITLRGWSAPENIFFKTANGYSALTELTIPSSITAIGKYQFCGFKTIETVTMSDSVTSIGQNAFSGCSSLREIRLSANISVIDEYAFSYCTSLSSIVIPDKVTDIKYYAFRSCESLADVKFSSNSRLQTIGAEAFYGCSNLTSVVIPGTVLKVGRDAFAYPLQTIYYMRNANAFDNIEGKNYLNVSGSTIYYYSENVPMNTEYTYWHYNENSTATLWVQGTVVNGKEYTYSHTETVVTDQYWGMLKAAEAQGMLEFLFPSSELGVDLAQQQIEMVTSSSTKAEYEQKLCAFSASTGQGASYKFENGKVTIAINGQPQIAIDYVEFDNVIYLANGSPLCYIDTENNCIYEFNETEYNTVWHYYELVSND